MDNTSPSRIPWGGKADGLFLIKPKAPFLRQDLCTSDLQKCVFN